MTQKDRLSWGNGPGSPNSHFAGGCDPGSCNLALSFKKGTERGSLWGQHSQAKEFGGGSCMIPMVLKPHFGEEVELCQREQANVGRASDSEKGLSPSVATVAMWRCLGYHQVNLLATTTLLRKSIPNGHPTLPLKISAQAAFYRVSRLYLFI